MNLQNENNCFSCKFLDPEFGCPRWVKLSAGAKSCRKFKKEKEVKKKEDSSGRDVLPGDTCIGF